MTVGSLFAKIGIQIEGFGQLKAVENSMNNIASAATRAVAAINAMNAALGRKRTPILPAAPVVSPGSTVSPSSPSALPPLLPIPAGASNDSEGGLSKTISGLKKFTVVVAAAAAAVDALNYAFIRMLGNALKSSQAMSNFATETGVSAQELQDWQFVAVKNGGTAKDIEDSIRGILDASRAIALGDSSGIGPWQLLGLEVGTDPIKVLDQLKSRIQDLDPTIARKLLKGLGVNDSTYDVIMRMNVALDRLKERYKLTADEQKRLTAANNQWEALKFQLQAVGLRFAAVFEKPMQAAIKVLTALLDIFTVFVDWLQKGSVAAQAVKWGIWLLAGAFVALGLALSAVAVALGVATAAAVVFQIAMAPIMPIILAISGVILGLIAIIAQFVIVGALGALVLQDIMTFAQGGDSAIGRLWERFKRFFTDVKDGFKNLIPDWAKTAFSVIAGGPGGVQNIASTPSTPSGAVSSAHQENNVNVTVNGATNPQETGRVVGNTMRQELTNAAYQMPLPTY